MKTTRVKVPWKDGLHMLPAGRIVEVAKRFRARVRLRIGARVADATSVLGLVVLCATLNTPLEVEAAGDDEQEALDAVASCFEPGNASMQRAPER